MAKRLFYNIEMRAKREMANCDYTDIEALDKGDRQAGCRIVIDPSLRTHGAEAKAMVFDQILKGLDEYYA